MSRQWQWLCNALPGVIVRCLITVLLLSLPVSYSYASAASGNHLALSDVIRKIINNYPSLDVAALEIQRARQEFAKVESQLGWVVTAQAGISRDVSFIDSPTDHYEAGVGFAKKFESGSSVELSGNYTYDDSEASFSTLIPNPSERTRLDLNYRIPLAQGESNTDYTSARISAQSGLVIQQASQQLMVDNLIGQSMSLYYDLVLTYIRIEDAKSARQRTQRLLLFVEKNKKLGLSEKKDILRVAAQLKRQIALFDSLQVIWHQQKAELNRLMGEAHDKAFVPLVDYGDEKWLTSRDELIELALKRNPELNIQKGKLQLAEAEIARARDIKRDRLDLVMSLGNRAVSGDTPSGDVENNEVVGGARIEYRAAIDKRGVDAGLYQAMLQKEQAQTEIKRLERDLKYKLNSLFDQISANKQAVASNVAHYKLEKNKIDDAVTRYREGRATTNELIDYEDALQASYLAHQNQKIILSRNIANISLLAGKLWDESILDTRVDRLSVGRGQ